MMRSNKRRLATFSGCQFDLRSELPKIFAAFEEACEKYEKEIRMTPPQSRARGFEASLLNSKMIQSIQNHFEESWKFGKYKRFILRVNGYQILFKKLNSKNLPMNIKTVNSQAISNQLSLPLFGNTTYVEEPILFFGYRKDKFGIINNPKLVYVDDSKVRWIITSDNVEITETTTYTKLESTTESYPEPKLKKSNQKKKTGS